MLSRRSRISCSESGGIKSLNSGSIRSLVTAPQFPSARRESGLLLVSPEAEMTKPLAGEGPPEELDRFSRSCPSFPCQRSFITGWLWHLSLVDQVAGRLIGPVPSRHSGWIFN